MTTNRRTFLKSSAALAAVLPLARLSAQPNNPVGTAIQTPKSKIQNKQGLLFDRADLPRIRANLDHPRLAAIKAHLTEVDHAADLAYLPTTDLRNRVMDMRIVREMLERAAFAYTVYGNPKDLELARAALDRLMDYDPWDYFLEGEDDVIGLQRAPEATIAVCCTLDWLGDALPPEVRERAEHQVATKGAPACYNSLYSMMYPDRVRGWSVNNRDDDIDAEFSVKRWPLILNATNLKVIPIAALGVAALWLHGRHPQADTWLDMARRSARSFSAMYGTDGAYDEGVGYWGYTTLHLALFGEVLHRRLGIDERDLINYPGTIRYALVMTMPTLGSAYNTANEKQAYNFVPKGTMDPALDIVNFGDSGIGADVTVAPWVGRVAGDPLSNHVALNIGGMKHLPAAVWFDADAQDSSPDPALLDTRLSNDWVISRTGWDAPSSVVAFRSGGPANHEHADRNSIIFKGHGERLFHDPFKAAYDTRHPRWLLRETEAHTAVLIDGRGHQYHHGEDGTNSSWARAAVTGYEASPAAMQVTSDATPAYQLVNDKVRRVDRTVLYLKPDVLLILDRLDLAADAPAPFSARFQIFNEDGNGNGQVSGGNFVITRPHAGLRASAHRLGGEPDVALRQLDLPAEEGVFPFVEVTSPAAAHHVLLTVAAAHPTADAPGDLRVSTRASGWTITGTHRGLPVNVAVDPSRAILPFTIGWRDL